MAHILIIDDDSAIRDFLRRVLELKGHLVSTAEDGRDALTQFDESVDLVITDMLMPKMNGAQTIQNLKTRSPGLPIIGISGGSLTPAQTFLGVAVAVGADRTLEKPFNVLALYEAVTAMLKKSGWKHASRPAVFGEASAGPGRQLAVAG